MSAIAAAATLGVVGCGGGGGSGGGARTSQPDTGRMQAAIAGWSDAVRGFDGQLAGCGSRANPKRNFFSFCMKHPPLEYRKAAAAVRAEFGAACKQQAPRADAVLKRDLALLQLEIRVNDRLVNDFMDHRKRHGPPALVVVDRARAQVHRDLGKLRRLAGDC